MASVLANVLGFLFALGGSVAIAALDEGGKLAPEPTVNVVWVYFFLLVFLGICVGIGYAIWRASKNSAQSGDQAHSDKH